MKKYRVSLRLTSTGHITATIIFAASIQEVYRQVQGLYTNAEVVSITEIS